MIKKIFKENGFDVTEYQQQQLQKYYDLLTEWNKKINLTAITDYKDVIIKHFVDSAGKPPESRRNSHECFPPRNR